MDKPDVDHIEGLSPAISIDQKGASHNPRSTVGTVTEIYDYLRLLYARAGRPHCPNCGRRIQQQSVEQIVDSVLAMPPGTRLMVLAPLVRDRKGEYQQVFEEVKRAGFVRVRVDGEVHDVSDEIEPRNFSFNSPHGACKDCGGLGSRLEIDPQLVIQNRDLSLAEGAVVP